MASRARTPAADGEPGDEVLAARAQNGDRAAFETLVRRFTPRLMRFLLSRAANRADAEDAVQQTFLQAYRGLAGFDVRRRLAPWLLAIAARELARLARRRPPSAVALDGVAVASDPPADPGPVGLWVAARARLNPETCAALWLRYGEDLAPGEIAAILGRSSVWVRVTLWRALRALRSDLADVPAARAALVGERP